VKVTDLNWIEEGWSLGHALIWMMRTPPTILSGDRERGDGDQEPALFMRF
jgi:hypothetical protein